MLSDKTFRRWSASALAIACALFVVAVLHLIRHHTNPEAFRTRWLGQEWLLVWLALAQVVVVALGRFLLLRDRASRAWETADAIRRLAHLEQGLDSIGDGVAIWSAAGELLTWNRRFATLTGFVAVPLRGGLQLGEFVSRSAQLLFPASHEAARATWIAARHEGHERADGAPHEFMTQFGRRIELRDQRVADDVVVTIVRDVTAAFAAEMRLAESEARFRDGIENLADGFLLWDADDRLVAINRRARELLPHLADMRMIGRTFSECALEALERGRPELDATQRAEWLKRRLDNRRKLAPHELYPANGSVIVALERRTEQGGTAQLLRDITAERRARELTENALRVERESSAKQRRFASIAGHEFRTPLAIIDSSVQRIDARLETAPPSELRLRLARIREAVMRMTGLIETTLESGRRDAWRGALAAREIDVAQLMRDAVARQTARGIHLRITLDAPASPVPFVADPILIDEALTNLLSNAVKFSPRARRVDVSLRDTGESVSIEVRDYGVGIPGDEIRALFARPLRVRTAATAPGTGIGLQVVRELVELHGGSVDVKSQPGQGSTFAVHLPRRPVAAQRAAD